jgi:hypothetical protein
MGPSCVDANGFFDIADVPVDRERHDVPTLDNSPRRDVVIPVDAMDGSADGYDVMFSDTQGDVPPDFGTFDTGVRDTGRVDVAVDRGTTTSGCVSGATGNLAVRFSWQGSGSGSTASVRYEANDLPDTSRWRVTAASRSIGYTPVYDDTFLGPGGLDLEGTAFMDVELSTSGLSAIRGATIAIYGRSFDTTASGSFSWQTFTGTGAAPSNLVANSPPYEWYGSDATLSFVPGDSGVLLRIYPGPSSDALIVSRVEICFDAF